MTRLLFAVLCVVALSFFLPGYAIAIIEGSTTGYNTFIGNGAGAVNTSDNSANTFIGYRAGVRNTLGYENTFVGSYSGIYNTGWGNSFFGFSSGFYTDSGNLNTFIGYDSGISNTTGELNTFVGAVTGYNVRTGYGNVFLGFRAGDGVDEDTSNRLYIDNCYVNSGAPEYACIFPLIYGEFDNRVVKISGQVIVTSSTSASDVRQKKEIEPLTSALDKVMKLKGVSYKWKTDENPGSGFGKGRQIGLIAQDVERVLPELVYTDAKGYKSLAYDKLVPVLVEALKEQESEIKEQKTEIKELKEKLSRLDRLEAKINRLEAKR